MSALNEHDDDCVGHDPRTGEKVTRRQWRETLEAREFEGETLLLEMRRMLETDLTDAQLDVWGSLFKQLGAQDNPAVLVSYWEGQIDFASHLRSRDAALRDAAAGPVVESTPDIPETLLTDAEPTDPADEPESAVVEGTLDRHTFDPDPDAVPNGTEPECVFSTSVNVAEGGIFVCGLPYDAPPHRALGSA